MVARQNLTVYQGADYRRALEFKDNSAVLMDLTGYEFRGQVKLSYQEQDPVFSFGFTLRDQVSDTGIVDMILTAVDSSAVSINKETNYIYDIEMVDADGYVTRVLEGRLKLYPEVTKA
jgi:hypothetical protein